MRFVFSTPTWVVSGVNSFTRNLIRELSRRGHDAELLVIRQGLADSSELPLPDDIAVHHLEFDNTQTWWRSRWEALRDYLHASAPVVYLQNYDFENSAVAPSLEPGVSVIGVVHSDDADHFEHLQRCGRWWDAAIAVSRHLHGEMLRLAPEVRDRAHLVPYGVPPREQNPQPGRARTHELRILYTGRFNEPQKRVSDLPKIARQLHENGVPFFMALVGNGPEDARLRDSLGPFVTRGCVRFAGAVTHDEMLQLYEGFDCLLLPSAYEGLPLALLEAMSAGCVPVVSEIRSGIPDTVRAGINGFTASPRQHLGIRRETRCSPSRSSNARADVRSRL